VTSGYKALAADACDVYRTKVVNPTAVGPGRQIMYRFVWEDDPMSQLVHKWDTVERATGTFRGALNYRCNG